jgi:hypothetical protein
MNVGGNEKGDVARARRGSRWRYELGQGMFVGVRANSLLDEGERV